ncbi:hypothetical protein KDRO_B05970 [Kluyveromyces lactis]|nr:hypothetical protein KDRO_B05970 [Kluyveromyces lactis]
MKAAVFSDFDGTITLQDSNDYLTDNLGFGKEERLKVFSGVLDGNKPFRDGFKAMLDSVHEPLDSCIEQLLAHIKLDPGFVETAEWCAANDVPLVVISSGMKPIIEALIGKLVGTERAKELGIEVIANGVDVDEATGEWHIVYRDDTPHGHDKAQTIEQCKKRFAADKYFYCGDGVSDLTAARECDVLFAREGCDLAPYCDHHGIPYILFNNFTEIKDRIAKELS